MSLKHLRHSTKTMLLALLLTVLVGLLLLVIGSRTMEVYTQEDTEQSMPAVPSDGPTYTIVLGPSVSPGPSSEQ